MEQLAATQTYNPLMARIWKERFDSVKHSGVVLDPAEDTREPIARHYKHPTLTPHEVLFVRVCSFTFRFDSKQQIERVLEYYEKKTVPSSIIPESVMGAADHWEVERWFEKLPLYLREEPKRLKVVKALREALSFFDR
ncbi:MAG: hypothetical protein AB7O65_08460 [Candidatus Korobacteraceae bacterium]